MSKKHKRAITVEWRQRELTPEEVRMRMVHCMAVAEDAERRGMAELAEDALRAAEDYEHRLGPLCLA